MVYKKEIVGIAGSDLKKAYLYFDYVIPVFKYGNFPGRIIPPAFDGTQANINHALMGLSTQYGEGRGPLNDEILFRLGKKRLKRIFNAGIDLRSSNDLNELMPYIAQAISSLSFDLKKQGYLPVPIIDDNWIKINSKTGFETISLISSNLLDIDTDFAEWNQISEFKRDKKSKSSLRNYRLFWYENYSNKPKEFIEDDLSHRYEKFISVAKKHGFNITYTTMNSILNSKAFATSSLVALSAAMVGDAKLVNASLLTGLTIDIGKLSLNIMKTRIEQKGFIENNELSYLYKISKKLQT